MTKEWNFADVWEAVAEASPAATAQAHGEQRYAWGTFDRRADGIARALLDAGLQRHDKVALYLYNAPEYLESAFATMKASLVPVNTNYRYRHDELYYLWDNADAAAVVFHGEFTRMIEELRPRCQAVRLWIHVEDGSGPCPEWAVPYECAANCATQRTRSSLGRSGDDPLFIYTGGTTGRPKGVIWRQHDLYLASNTTADPSIADLAHVRDRVLATAVRPIGLPAAPLMHGTGFVFAATILNRGGTVVTMPERKFDVLRLLDTLVAHRVSDVCIVGDAFCMPIVDALDAQPGRWDLSHLKVMSSSGMAWSSDVKRRLLVHAPELLMIDFLNSSEASGMGRSITSRRSGGQGARFQLGKNAFVIDAAGAPVKPGSGEVGRVAVRGFVPIGYYKDPERTAATFPVVDGVRCAVPGDYARVEADGTIKLLGRGSTSINTGGEKVFPEEVEAAIKAHPATRDAIVVGVPDPRFGEVVAAMVQCAPGAALDATAVVGHVRERLAGHKVPRHVMIVASIERAATGKADYAAVRERIAAWLAAGAKP